MAPERIVGDRPHRESPGWIERLRAVGPDRDRAIEELRAILLRAARFEVSRRAATMPHVRRGDWDDLAEQSANDALVAVLAKLDDYRGDSRFTTWAYKFALLEASVKLRRRAWQEREVPLDAEVWPFIPDPGSTPDAAAETGELMRALRDGIDSALTPHQRTILVALALNDVPIDVLAERLDTTRGALYKTLHDARRKLRAHLAEQGIRIGAIAESEA